MLIYIYFMVCLISFQGFGPEENTWEPKENLDCPELIKAFEDKLKLKKEQGKRKSGAGGEEAGEPPSKKLHPTEDMRPRGFDRGLQAERIIGATDSRWVYLVFVHIFANCKYLQRGVDVPDQVEGE